MEHVVETDVLVIGGGMAGCFAAIKAKGSGVEVILVDKGYVSNSGSTPFASSYAVFNPEWGHKLDDWINQHTIGGEYLNNREWNEIVFKNSYAIYQDLVSWGMRFHRNEDGEIFRGRSIVAEWLRLEQRKISQVLRKQTIARGVKIMDRIMITDLLTQNGRVVGAIGIPRESYDLYIFKAKATVISTGCAGFKPVGWPITELTGDGQAMAYRAGAELLGNEFVDVHSTWINPPGSIYPIQCRIKEREKLRGWGWGTQGIINAEGNKIPTRYRHINLEFEVHAGRAPLISEMNPTAAEHYGVDHRIGIVGCATLGMANHTTEGISPINTKCATSLPGLYAAGDSLGTMLVGAVYSGRGFATACASVTGTLAGLNAAEYTLQVKKIIMDEEKLAKLKKNVSAPLERKGGFSPRWVTQVLQNLLMPYFILYIKHGKRLSATLTLVEFLRDHLVPKLTANDPHELRLAHETKNMVLNAEMRLRSSLFRTESRGTHYREDYPRRDDPNWLAWVKLKEKDGTMMLWKEPIPEKWWPDLSKQYAKRYPFRFPE